MNCGLDGYTFIDRVKNDDGREEYRALEEKSGNEVTVKVLDFDERYGLTPLP